MRSAFPKLTLVTGEPFAGTSTTALALAEVLADCVLIQAYDYNPENRKGLRRLGQSIRVNLDRGANVIVESENGALLDELGFGGYRKIRVGLESSRSANWLEIDICQRVPPGVYWLSQMADMLNVAECGYVRLSRNLRKLALRSPHLVRSSRDRGERIWIVKGGAK